MRRIVVGVLSLCMLASPAAYAGGAGNGDPSTGSTAANSTSTNPVSNSGAPAAPAQPASSQPATPPVNPSPSSAELQNEIDQMRALVQSQSDQIQKQQEELREMKAKLAGTTSNSNAPAQPVSSSTISTAAPAPAIPSIAVSTPAPALVSASPPAASPMASETDTDKLEKKLSDLAFGKIKIGGTFYGDWAYYPKTGFGPQFLTQINQEGPGNNEFNSFDVTRTYINILYTPNDAVTLRFTPNIYRQVDVSSGTNMGKNAAISSSSNGNLGFRLKYAYIDFNTLFSKSQAFKADKLTVGQTTNPLVDWEEGLYGYRYVNLTPWNYLSLSSTYTGVTLHGPIMVNGKEYLDYHIGVFNTASFHAIETNDRKQFMGRMTWYPFGTTADRTGFGLTAFDDYGYTTASPDSRSVALNRMAVLVHYQNHSKAYEIVGEYDLGRNAFSVGNLFSGAGPADAVTGATVTAPDPYVMFTANAKAILGGEHTRQQGADVFGHVKLGKSPFALFGMFEYFQPNTNFSGTDAMDFERVVGGLSYHYNDHFEFSFDSQNLIFTRKQFTLSDGSNAVPSDTNAIFLNLLFNY